MMTKALPTSALEKRLKITAKPKEISIDDALALLDEWTLEFDEITKDLSKQKRKK